MIRFLRSPGRPARQKLTACGLVLLVTLLIISAGAEVTRASLNPAELQTWFGREISVADANPFRMLAARNKQTQKQIPAWIWIYPQWTARHGEAFAVLLSLLILLGWSLMRWSRSRKDQQSGSADVSPRPQNWQAGVRLLRRSSLIALLVVTTVYLAVTPSLIKAENRDYQKRSQALFNPFESLQKVETIQSEIKNDPALIRSFDLLIKEIQQRLTDEAAQIQSRESEIGHSLPEK